MNKFILFTGILFCNSFIQADAYYKLNDEKGLSSDTTIFFSHELNGRIVDISSRIFTDEFPDSAQGPALINVPRNYTLAFQLALISSINQVAVINFSEFTDAAGITHKINYTINKLLPVHVEGNTQGSLINYPGGKAPDSWNSYFIRKAPFDIFEVVNDVPVSSIPVANKTTALLIQIKIPAELLPGVYKSMLTIHGSTNDISIPVSFTVHKTVLKKEQYLNCTHWLSELPSNLKSGKPVKWWSEEHWKLLEKAGRLLKENGDDIMYTPLINTKYPLIQTIRDENGKISFDFKKFDRWIKMYKRIGFTFFAGKQLVTQKDNLYIRLSKSNERISFNDLKDNLSWFAFLEIFLKNLNVHLDEIGIRKNYIQFLYDEPSDLTTYQQYYKLLKQCMPDVRSVDAINSKPQMFSENVDIEVFNLPGIILQQNKVVKQRIKDGQPFWLYNCSSPYPPYPNRNLDLPLTENRIWPWLSYKFGATGYLWWAANLYRGISDEYKSSLGPFPDGTNNPGHPPGGNWFYYRSENGLLQSLRIMNFREGMIDVSLLNILNRSDPNKVKEIISQLIYPEIEKGHDRRFKDYLTTADVISKGYSTSPLKYNEMRNKILQLLDKYPQ